MGRRQTAVHREGSGGGKTASGIDSPGNLERGGWQQDFFFFLNLGSEEAIGDEGLKTKREL